MSDKLVYNYKGCGFIELLFLIFLTLKLTGYITWSWWWVTAPLWGTVIYWFCIIVSSFVCCLIYYTYKK